jgi:hypothetical protein
MAKGKDLAKLAALGALGYMLTRGGKGKESTTDTGDETERLVNRGGPRRQITDYMKKAPEAEDANYGNEGMRSSRVSPAAVKDNTTGIRMPSGSPDGEAGMSRGTRSVPNDNYSNEGRSSARAPSTVSSSEAGMKNYKPRRNSTPSNTVSSSEEGMRNYKPRVTPQAAPFRGGQPGYDEAGNFLGGRRGYDEAGNPMKKGGRVKKMASGGMTASRRADGIASKGKTKCKMY